MKRILVPTDFSPIARNTLDYATELAENIFAELILFHAYYQPVLAYDVTVVQPIYTEIEEECVANLEELKQQVSIKHPDLKISIEYQLGLPAERINSYAAENKIDFIIIGAQGAGYLTERLLGSIATSLVRDAVCPILVIDKNVRFRHLDKIVLAADYQDTVEPETLKPLKTLMTNFDAHLYILHIAPKGKSLNFDELYAKYELDNSFKHYDHSLVASHDEDIINGINGFVDLHNLGMVVMVPHKHTFWARMFGEPSVKRMAFHSNVPLLILHTNH